MAFIAVDNPVMRAELKHQRQIIRNGRTGWFWIMLAVLMLVPSLLLGAVYLVVGLLQLDLTLLLGPETASTLSNLGVMLLIMHIAMYIVVTLVTLALSARSINREHEGHTWDNLLLTNMTAREIIRGKCWATLRAMWGDHLLILLLRLGFVAWMMYNTPIRQRADTLQLAVAVLSVILLSLTDSALSVILGILAPVSGRSPWVAAVALGIRAFFSLFILGASFALGLIGYVWNPYLTMLLPFAVLPYIAFTAIMLRITEWVAVRNQVSPARSLAL